MGITVKPGQALPPPPKDSINIVQFPGCDLSVFEAILSIQRFSIWPNTEKLS